MKKHSSKHVAKRNTFYYVEAPIAPTLALKCYCIIFLYYFIFDIFIETDYRVTHLLANLGWVDLDLGSSPGWWAARYCSYLLP